MPTAGTQRPSVTIYTDGGSDPNPGPGGWGVLLIDDSTGTRKELSGAAPDTTNNRMELTAALEALRALNAPCNVTLFTDSQYLKNGITKWIKGWIGRGWLRANDEPVLNADLWQALHAETRRHTIAWQWVKGHAGHEWNERVDQLATAARLGLPGMAESVPAANAPAASVASIEPEYEIALRVSVTKSGGPGGYAFRVARIADNNMGELITGRDALTTANRLLLRTALTALRMVPSGAAVQVFSPGDFLYKGMVEWLPNWQRRNWRNSKNKPVEHSDLWQALAAESEQRSVLWTAEPTPRPALARGLEKLASDAAQGK